mgnify:CR=1 FL=1
MIIARIDFERFGDSIHPVSSNSALNTAVQRKMIEPTTRASRVAATVVVFDIAAR